jgi:hypothetical protein
MVAFTVSLRYRLISSEDRPANMKGKAGPILVEEEEEQQQAPPPRL